MVTATQTSLTGRGAARWCSSLSDSNDFARLRHDILHSRPPFYHDGTERPVQRPIDADEQEEYYSGKKKCHTIKNILLTDEACYIRFMSETYAGKWHEKSIVDAAHYRLA